MPASTQVPLQPPQDNPFNVQATKHYVFNETGNIMLATTDSDSSQIQAEVRQVFAEVAVFFAAMTKAITETINKDTGKPYNLYNYEALSQVIDASGLFVHVTESDLTHTTTSFGMDFSKELIEALLGLATGAGEMSFASAMIASMGKEGLRIQSNTSGVKSTVANIVFVCEHLLGMPIVSAIVVSADMTKNTQTLSVGPCFSESSTQVTLQMHKDTYLFVTPTFIREYASDLTSIESNPAYNQFIVYLKNMIARRPVIQDIVDNSAPTTPVNSLKIATGSGGNQTPVYLLQGVYLGAKDGTLSFAAGSKATITLVPNTWTDDSVQFTVGGAADPGPLSIELRLSGTPAAAAPDFKTAAAYVVTT